MWNIVQKTVLLGGFKSKFLTPFGPLGFFLSLDAIPRALGHACISGFSVTENMRMPTYHLVRDSFDNIAKCKAALFFGHARMEHHLQQQIAKFFAQIVHIIALYGIEDFISFLKRIGHDGFETLLHIPWTAGFGVTERCHDFQKAIDIAGWFHHRSVKLG